MNPALFSQIVTILGILGCVAGAVQEALGSQSHYGIIAGVIVTVLGKVGAVLAASQSAKAVAQESAQDHALNMVEAHAQAAQATPPSPITVNVTETPAQPFPAIRPAPVPASKAETAIVPAITTPPKG